MPVQILNADCVFAMETLPSKSVQMCVTSPPYFGLRDYGVDGQLGLEATPEKYIAGMVEVFREVHRVLKDDGTLWVNIGDSYAGSGKGRNGDGSHQEGGKQGTNAGTVIGKIFKSETPDCKPKDLIGIPWMLAFALRADGWYLRQDIIWHKPNPMPESVRDRCTKAHEYIFLLSKSERYLFDAEAISEPVAASTVARLAQPNLANQAGSDRVPGKTNGPMHAKPPRFGGNKYGNDTAEEHRTKSGNEYVVNPSGRRNRRTVWTVTTKPFKGAHFATFPPDLIVPCILAGSRANDTVLDPFGGAGTTGLVAKRLGRKAILCELNPAYAAMAKERIAAG